MLGGTLVVEASSPVDSVVDCAKAFSFDWIDGLHESDATIEVQSEVGLSVTILARMSQADAIRERCLESIEVGPDDIQVLIHNKACQMLPHTLPHDSCLAMIHAEAFFHENRGGVYCKSLHASFERLAAGESQVVRISCVDGANRFRQASQTAVHTVSAEVGECR